jgi:hypothetical protein
MAGGGEIADLPPGVAFFEDFRRMPKVTWNDVLGIRQLPQWCINIERLLMRIIDEVDQAKEVQRRQLEEAQRVIATVTGRR